MDQLLVSRGLAESREKARAMVMAGQVEVNGARVDKPGRSVDSGAPIRVKGASLPYVSRGGLKLEAALNHFPVQVKGRVVLDVGASTGGFTDCLLQHGAAKVIAVDVGYGQLDWRLRTHPQVRVLEKTNIRHLTPEDLGERGDGAVVDVSFISLKIVIPAVSRLLTPEAFVVALIKPQFEVGKGMVGKGGVVRDPAVQDAVVEELKTYFENSGWKSRGILPSPILGPKGNHEFLIYLTR